MLKLVSSGWLRGRPITFDLGAMQTPADVQHAQLGFFVDLGPKVVVIEATAGFETIVRQGSPGRPPARGRQPGAGPRLPPWPGASGGGDRGAAPASARSGGPMACP